jgi:hyperosmotically inducible protein
MRRFTLLLALSVLAVLGACRDEGAAEKAGRKIDEAIEQLTDPDEGALEKLGREADEALEDARRAVEEAKEGE